MVVCISSYFEVVIGWRCLYPAYYININKIMKDGVAGENTHSTSLHPLTKEEDFDTVP